MIEHFPFYLAIVILIVLLIMLAAKIRVAYPVLLVLAGLAISFIPGIPALHIDPELIFIIFLPPLLYEAAWNISWKELWRWRRIVSSFAFVVVFFTAVTVALVANACIPGFSLALGFLLGGIVSPPDAVSAAAITRFVRVPKRMASILEGESLLNDASSLLIFRFALIAVGTGQFVWHDAALSFVWMLAGGVGIGLLIGWLFMKAHKLLPTDANTDTILTIVAPYVMYIAAEEVHSSGVLAVVAGGLLLSNRQHYFLSSSSRLRGVDVWQSLVFVLNGIVFMLIGLDLPEITAGLGDVGPGRAVLYGVVITLVLVGARIIAAYGAVVVTLIMRNFITVADARHPGYKLPVVLGLTGMRGVVSLAAALSIPVHLDNGVLFPQRNLILFITFIVILLTLVLQGLSLPFVIRKADLPEYDDFMPEAEADRLLQTNLCALSLAHLEANYDDVTRQQGMWRQMSAKWSESSHPEQESWMSAENKRIYLEILEQQRRWLLDKNRTAHDIDEDLVRKHLHRIDIEEERLRTY